jgi:hypothetical protein
MGCHRRCRPGGHRRRDGRVAAGQDRELNARTKATILTLDTITESNQAVDYEIHPQLWSMGQPPFMELVTRLQKDISSKG